MHFQDIGFSVFGESIFNSVPSFAVLGGRSQILLSGIQEYLLRSHTQPKTDNDRLYINTSLQPQRHWIQKRKHGRVVWTPHDLRR